MHVKGFMPHTIHEFFWDTSLKIFVNFLVSSNREYMSVSVSKHKSLIGNIKTMTVSQYAVFNLFKFNETKQQ